MSARNWVWIGRIKKVFTKDKTTHTSSCSCRCYITREHCEDIHKLRFLIAFHANDPKGSKILKAFVVLVRYLIKFSKPQRRIHPSGRVNDSRLTYEAGIIQRFNRHHIYLFNLKAHYHLPFIQIKEVMSPPPPPPLICSDHHIVVSQ